MKNKLFLLGLLYCITTATLLVSCSKDGENESSASMSELVVGDWECTHSLWHWEYIDYNGVVETDTTQIDGSVGGRWKLTKEGKIYIQGKDKGSYVVTGDDFYLDKSVYWVHTYKIKKVSSKELILSYLDEREHGKREHGSQGDEFTVEARLEFKRI